MLVSNNNKARRKARNRLKQQQKQGTSRTIAIPKQVQNGLKVTLYQQLNVGVDGAGAQLTMQMSANGLNTANLWGGNFTDSLPAQTQFLQKMQNWQEYTVVSVAMKFLPYDVASANITGVNATYIVHFPIESVQDANVSVPTGSWFTQPGYKVSEPLKTHTAQFNIAKQLNHYNAALYLPTGYPSTSVSARGQWSVNPSLSLRVENPLKYATTSLIPALPWLGRLYYRMDMHFMGAIFVE